jgi:tetratricopeptide (TPR) repeat protein
MTTRHAFDLWQAGKLVEAETAYSEGLANLDPTHWSTPSVYQEYALVLTALGRNAEAKVALEQALQLELDRDPSGTTPSAHVARYFLGEHLLRGGEPLKALQVITPSLAIAGGLECALRVVEAESYDELGRIPEAEESARLALARSAAGPQRDRIRERLGRMLAGS